VKEYDVLCFNDVEGYEKKHVYREKCNGGGIVVFFRKWLSQYVKIVKCVADCMIWFKFDKCIMPNKFKRRDNSTYTFTKSGVVYLVSATPPKQLIGFL
jgi:hypothetical protein